MLSPYFLQYAGRISVILLPWAGLPFMLGLTIVALRRGGWREPALFAVVVALVSGINASSIIYVGVAPILWILYAVVVLRESTWRHAVSTALRIGVLTLGACLWWIAGLGIEAAYGVNVLKYTETVPSTSATSNAADIFRGLGYWYFYGTDHTGPVDDGGHSLHPGHLAPGDLVRRAGARPGGVGLRALARARLLPAPSLRGVDPLRRARSRSPTPPPSAAGSSRS